jgi:hypothetical protein
VTFDGRSKIRTPPQEIRVENYSSKTATQNQEMRPAHVTVGKININNDTASSPRNEISSSRTQEQVPA